MWSCSAQEYLCCGCAMSVWRTVGFKVCLHHLPILLRQILQVKLVRFFFFFTFFIHFTYAETASLWPVKRYFLRKYFQYPLVFYFSLLSSVFRKGLLLISSFKLVAEKLEKKPGKYIKKCFSLRMLHIWESKHLIKMCNIFDHYGVWETKLLIAFSFRNTQKKQKAVNYIFLKVTPLT